jgi:signal transduction histidine kinase
VNWFRNLSIRRKLTLIIISVSAVVLLISTLINVSNEYRTRRAGLIQEIATVAEIVGRNSDASIIFNDPDRAQTMLKSLSAKQEIESAFIFDENRQLFAAYPNGATTVLPESAPMDQPIEMGEHIRLIQRIATEDGTVGYIVVNASLVNFYSQLAVLIGFAAAIFAGSLVIALIISAWMQRVVSNPIASLAQSMKQVSETRNYSVRIGKHGNDELGELVDRFHEMLAEIEQREKSLSVARQQAELANRAKTSFLANMSHELRTPLNAIIGFSEMMARQLFGPLPNRQYQEYAQDIHDSGTHLLDIINTILDLSKVEAGAVKLIESEISILDMVQRLERLFRERANNAAVLLSHSFADGAPRHLIADDRLVRQCLSNLLSNALKFTPAGGSVTVIIDRAADGGLSISVRDTGIGIAPQDIVTALEPFGQIDSSLSRKYQGTGLGLPIVKSYVELHGGRLGIVSRPGEGTTVTLHFPISRILPVAPAAVGETRQLA